MIVRVLQYAFGEGEVREVSIDDQIADQFYSDHECDPAAANMALEAVFYWGQNDHQNVPGRYSVSMGDVAELWGKHYLCCSVGWKELSEESLKAYQAMSKDGRQMLLLRMQEHHL